MGRLLDRLDVEAQDRAEIIDQVATLTCTDYADIDGAASAAREQLGNFAYPEHRVFAQWPDQDDRPRGLIPLLGLLQAIPDVRAYHAARDIPAEATWAALAGLQQQFMVFRRTFGEFGVDGQQWLSTIWSGAFFWFGRLQFNLIPWQGSHAISVHIPPYGPLEPAAVDTSLALARDFFTRHFSDAPAPMWHCDSWLLDPRLAEVLPPSSNIASFQRRWRLIGESREADGSVIFFVFYRRPAPGEDLRWGDLPRQTSLQRAVLDHLDTGGHWYSHTGVMDLDD